MTLAQQKAALRVAALARRDGLDPAYRAAASQRITERVLAMAPRFAAGPVSVFWPIRSEIDTRPLMRRLAASGMALALPVVAKPGLKFRAWQPGEKLEAAGFGLSEPPAEAPEVVPATMLVPLAAFDRNRNRIGYGAGYYDATIAALSETVAPLTIGLAFDAQEVAAVPVEPHDCVLDAVVTEDRLFAREPDLA